VLLKPHIDLLRNNKPQGQYWRGDIGTNFNASQVSSAYSEVHIWPFAGECASDGCAVLL
jgi:hypothetical protein